MPCRFNQVSWSFALFGEIKMIICKKNIHLRIKATPTKHLLLLECVKAYLGIYCHDEHTFVSVQIILVANSRRILNGMEDCK